MRDKIVAGNWKMNNDVEAGLKLTSEIANMVTDEVDSDVKVIVAPPFTGLAILSKGLAGGRVKLAAQNCSEHDSGAYTGEISVSMLESAGAKYVIIGHSERREYFKETDAQLATKVNKVLKAGLTPIFCCGEQLDIREANQHFEVVCKQLTDGLFHLSEEEFRKVVVAYEPIWAIGTGVTASTDQAQEMHAALRSHISSKYGTAVADSISILYGGSCKPSNAQELFACADVDGGLIGGASLKSRDFVDILKSF